MSESVHSRNGLAISSLVLGVVSIVFGIIPLFWWIAVPLGVLALVFGRSSKGKTEHPGCSKAGFITGLIGTIFGIIGLVIFTTALNDFSNDIEEIESEYNQTVECYDKYDIEDWSIYCY